MGLASWSGKSRQDAASWYFGNDIKKLDLGDKYYHRVKIMSGNPFLSAMDNGGGLNIDWDVLDGLPRPNQWDNGHFSEHANLAASVQENLEESALALVRSLADSWLPTEGSSGGGGGAGGRNIALVGGVALNSVLNGRVAREGGFDRVFVPPAPGDEGVAVGCALYGLQVTKLAKQDEIARPVSLDFHSRAQ